MTNGPTLLGIRHHGPGSARAVAAALEQLRPDAVLIEGPPEADGLTALAAEKDLVPPVALLAHVVDDPARAAFWPFAVFSPEWVALRYAVEHQVPVRFIDLPAAHSLAADAPVPGGPGARPGSRTAPPRTRSPPSPRPPATTTPSAGGRTWSSTAPPAPTHSPRSRPWRRR